MSINRFNEESKEVLSLGSLHEEIEKEKTQRKRIGLPIFLIFLGISLMLIGTFYNDILKFVKPYFAKEEVKKEVKKNESITYLSCNYDNSEPTLGLARKINIKYEFKDKLLQKVTTTNTITVIENSADIGSSNIELFHQKYKEAFKDINVNGLKIKTSFTKSKLKNIITIDYQQLDITQVPKNNYLKIANKKDQTYREIKETEGRSGHICKII